MHWVTQARRRTGRVPRRSRLPFAMAEEPQIEIRSAMWAHGKHTIKAGVNAPDSGWRGLDDRSNRDGTYYFSSLSSYLQRKPFLLRIHGQPLPAA